MDPILQDVLNKIAQLSHYIECVEIRFRNSVQSTYEQARQDNRNEIREKNTEIDLIKKQNLLLKKQLLAHVKLAAVRKALEQRPEEQDQ